MLLATVLEARRVIPYIIVLLALAFALGSLPHGTPGGSLLFQSTWLLYLIYLGPILVLGLMIALIILIGLNWRILGQGIGHGLVNSKRMRKRGSKYSLVITIIFWLVAGGVLINTRGTIFNPTNSTQTNSTIAKIVGESAAPQNPFLWGGFVPALSNLIQNSWFGIAFLGLLVVGGLVLVQSLRVARSEASEINARALILRRIEGLEMVNNALALIDDQAGDSRTRIIACYQNMIAAVSRLGAPVPPDLTARELESTIRSTFDLKGGAIGELTHIFEEARYSLHNINDEDALTARACLESIAAELEVQLDAK